MLTPKSRQKLAHELDATNDIDFDNCPHCVLAAPLEAVVPNPGERKYPGERAFAEPGTAPMVTKIMDGHSTPFGVCGTQKDGKNNYNVVQPGKWGGDEIVATYEAGQIVTVEWCANADHGGVYQYRLCDDANLVAKLLSSEAPTAEEYLEIEACYQRGILRCDAVESNSCGLEPRCDPTWGCAAHPGLYFHCEGTPEKSYGCQNTEEECPGTGGNIVRRQIKIPETFPTGRTVLSWRWDSDETVEIFAACADVVIEPTPLTPTRAPTEPKPTASFSPTPRPSLTTMPSTLKSHAPTNPPTGINGSFCCWYAPPGSPDECAACESRSLDSDWCDGDRARCLDCGGSWCEAPTSEPTTLQPSSPVPSVAPTTVFNQGSSSSSSSSTGSSSTKSSSSSSSSLSSSALFILIVILAGLFIFLVTLFAGSSWYLRKKNKTTITSPTFPSKNVPPDCILATAQL